MLKVHLEPAQATVTPGTGLILTVVVTNDGDAERTCRVRVVGLDAPWVEHSDGELTVPSGSRLEVPIRITLPLGFPRGETLVGFEVQADGGEPPVVVDTHLAVSDLESLNIGLSPVTVRGGWKGKFRLNIENRGTDPLTIKLTGRGVGPEETKSDLDFRFKPERITLRPGERVKTRGTVSGKRHVFGNPRRRALTVTAQGETAPRHVQGAFVQRPLMPRNVLRIVGLVLVLAMWAGGLTAGVNLTSGKGKSSAQDAAAQIDPAAAGPSGSDGTAAGGANGTGSEEAAVPAAGGAIAGQVKGPTDASGITVKLRPVALADDLSTDLAAQTVAFVSSSTEDAPKESAQTLRREPTGPVGPTATTTTDAEGKWAFGGLKTPANYEVTFSKAGFAERTYVVSVDDQAPTVALDVPMVPGNGSLSGTVKGPDGPLGGAVVTVTDGTVTFRATTPDSGDDAGKWSIDGLTTPATYMVSASLRGYGTESTSLALDSGGSKDGVDLTMVAGVGSISGHISGGGAKLGNITVTATNGDVTRTASTLTEGDAGAYSLPQLPIPGDYTISVAGNGWIPQTMALALKGNASKVDLDLVKTTATIVGTIKDSTGKTLASTGVTLAADKPIVKTLSAIDPAGTYELSGLAPGTYTLSFDRADFKTESTIVTVASGDRTTVDMTLTAQTGDKIPKDAVVRGIVRSTTTGAPITGVMVSTGEVTSTSTATASSSTTVATDATGGFLLDKLAPGSYDLKFTSAKYQPLTRTIRIGAKSDTTIDVTMLILGGVQGVVTDLTASRLPGVTVTVTNDPTATGQAAFTATTTTDNSGQYSLLEQLPTGKYVATFSLAGYSTRSRNFEAAAGTVAVGDSQLIELARIHGTIQTPDSSASGGFRALSGVDILIERRVGSTWTTVQSITNNSGEYLVTDLEPGDYRVTASKPPTYGTSVKLIDDLQLREERDGGLVLAPGAQTVSGRITYDDHGSPAPAVGVTVTADIVTGFDTLTIFPFIQPHVSTLTTTTNGTGDWTIAGQLSGTTGSYTYSGTGFTDIVISGVTAPITPGSLDRQMVPNPRDLEGTLSLIGAPSSALPSTNIRIAGGTTDVTVHPNTSGTYSFDDIPVGSYTMTLSGAGYQTRTVAITVPPGAAATPVVLSAQTLTKYSSITPTVRTGGGALLDGVDVSIGGAPQTTASGTTSFTSQLPGTYTITYTKAGYLTATRSLTLAAGQDLTATTNPAELAVNLLKLPSLTMTVNSHLSASTAALNTATVTGQLLDGGGNPTGPVLTTTRTNNDYTFAGLSPGNYRVTITAPDHDSLTVTSVTMVADTDQTLTRSLEAWSPLSVHLQSTFNSATTDLTGVASNVTAVRTLDAGGNAVTSQPTVTFSESAGGIYTSANVIPGAYTITANPSTHVSGSVARTVVAGTATAQSGLTLNQLARISITTRKKLDGSFSSLTTAAVTVTGPGGTATVTHTGGTNLFVADGLIAGSYTITVSATDHDPQTFTGVAIVAAQSYTNTVDLLAWAPLSLHLQTHFGTTTGNLTTASADVHAVRIKDASGTTVTGQPTINFSGGTGGIYTSSTNAQPGTYTITANPSTHVSGSVDAVSAAGDTPTQADLTIEQLPRITITTRSKLDGATSALNTATVTVTGPGGTATVTHAGGTNVYVADGLTPGSHTITVSRTDHDTQTFSGVAISAGQDYTDTVDLLAWTPITLHLQSHFGSTTGNLTTASADVHAVRIKDASGTTVTGQPTINFSGGTGGIYTSTINVTPGTYTITANPSTHVSGSVDKVAVAGTTPTDANLTIEQKPRITITTRSSLDSVNTALNTATVTVTGPGGTATVTHTGGTNVYVADGLSAGSYTITVSATDHDTQTFSGVAIASGDDYTNTVDLLAWTPVTLHLQSHFGASTTNLTGVAANVTAVRIKDAGGTTVTGQPTVTFTGAAGGIYTSTVNAVPGTYTITANPVTHVSDSVDKVVVAGTTPTDAQLTLEQKPRITITTNSRLDGVNTAFNTAVVTITGPGGTATVTHTGGTNVYVADALAPGSYSITVSGTDKDTQTFTGGSAVTIANGDDYTQTVNLLAWTPITVHVQGHFGSTTSNLTSIASSVTAVRTLDAAGGSVSGQPTVTFTGGTGGIYTSSGNVPPGTYSITGAPATHVSNSVTKPTVAGTTPTDAQLTLEQKPRITITTNSRLDGVNTAFNTAVVTITGPGGTATVTHTGGTNVYVADALTAGAYDITVSGTDKDTQTFTGGTAVTIANGDDYTQTVNLLAWTPITVHVQGHFGSSTTNLTSIASSVTAIRTLDAAGGSVSGQPTVTFTGGTGGIYTSSGNVPPGTYSITGAPATHVSNSVTKPTVAGTTPTTPDLTLEQLPRITITTNSRLDGVNTALNTATVTITGPGGTATVTHTGGTNVYVANGLTPGAYDITVSATDKDTQTFTGGTAVIVAGGDDYAQTVNLLAWTPIKVRLRGELNSVQTDLTSNAADLSAVRTLDAAGGTVTGQPTISFSGGTGGVYTSTINLTPGTYTITGDPANYDPNTVDVVAAAGTTPTQGLLIVQKLPALTVTVNSRLDSVDTDLTTATVTAQKLTGSCTGSSDSVGGNPVLTPGTVATNDYSFANLTAGCYKVIVSAANHVTQTFTNSTGNRVNITAGVAASLTVNLLKHPPLTLSLLGRNGSSAPFNTTFALPGATATMTATSGGSTTTLTDQGDGTYTKAAIVPGTYTLTVTAPNYGAMTAQAGIVIAAGVTHADLAGTLTATPGSITGTVRDSVTNGLLAGVSVTANFSGTPGRVATTDASGNYTITGLEPATWSVDYMKNTFSSLNVSVAVTAATASTSNQVLVQLGEEISGTVNGYAADPAVITSSTDNPKVPLAGALVTISRPGYTATRTSAVDGTYTFDDVPATTGANDYTIAFTHDKYLTRSVAKTTSVASSSNREDNLIAHTGTATVTVKDLEASASPLLVQNAVIQVDGVLLATPLTDTSNASGVTSFHLPPGTYTASLVTPPSGYLASAATVPITVGLSSGVDGTTLLGTGTTSVDYSISKAVSLDVTVAGLTGSDTADLAITWPGGTATASAVSGHALFDELPPNKTFTIQATNAKYTGGAASAGPLFLGDSDVATATLIPNPGTVEVQVDGLIDGDATKVTLDGVQSTNISDTGTYTFTNVRAGATLNVSYSNGNYIGAPLTIPALLAEEDRTHTGTGLVNLTVAPKDGTVTYTIAGLQTGDTATLKVTGKSDVAGLTNGAQVNITGIPAGQDTTIQLVATNYTGTSDVVHPTANQTVALGTKTLVRQTGSVNLTIAGLQGGDKADVSVTYTGADGSPVTVSNTGSVVIPNLPTVVTLTVTATLHAGFTGTYSVNNPSNNVTVTNGGTTNLTLTFVA